MSSFADKLEDYARFLVGKHVDPSPLDELFGGDIPNFKPWYSPKWMYEPVEGGVDRVFLGIHPSYNPNFEAGNACDKPGCDHERLEYVNYPRSSNPYNDWLDSGCWGPHGKGHQTKARRAFKSLYGDSEGINKFRFARCTNVRPFRSTGTSDIQQAIWNASQKWCKQLLNGLQPKTIICNGYQDKGMNPWATINELYKPEPKHPVCSGSAKVKLATMSFDGTYETTIIGLPHLSRSHFRRDHYDALCTVATKYDIA